MNPHLLAVLEIAHYSLCVGEMQLTACLCSMWVKNDFYIFKELLKNVYTETELDQKPKMLTLAFYTESLPAPVTTSEYLIPFTLRE